MGKCKTDVYRQGNWIYIIKSTRNFCPAKILQNYLNFVLINDKSDEYIFRAITKKQTTEKLRNVDKTLSYTRTRELQLDALVDIGLRTEDFSLHSLCSGWAILAVNRGVKDRLFKRNDRQKSENVKDGYIEDNLELLLVVKKCLRL